MVCVVFLFLYTWRKTKIKCNALKADLFRGSRGMPDNVCDDPLHVISREQNEKKKWWRNKLLQLSLAQHSTNLTAQGHILYLNHTIEWSFICISLMPYQWESSQTLEDYSMLKIRMLVWSYQAKVRWYQNKWYRRNKQKQMLPTLVTMFTLCKKHRYLGFRMCNFDRESTVRSSTL